MAKTRTFISFYYYDDSDLKLLLVGQAKISDCAIRDYRHVN